MKTVPVKELNGTGRQMCSTPKCTFKSVPGLIKGYGKCPFHWAEGVWGNVWASSCYPDHPNAIKE